MKFIRGVGWGGVPLGSRVPFRRPVEATKGRLSVELAERKAEIINWVGGMHVAYKVFKYKFVHRRPSVVVVVVVRRSSVFFLARLHPSHEVEASLVITALRCVFFPSARIFIRKSYIRHRHSATLRAPFSILSLNSESSRRYAFLGHGVRPICSDLYTSKKWFSEFGFRNCYVTIFSSKLHFGYIGNAFVIPLLQKP